MQFVNREQPHQVIKFLSCHRQSQHSFSQKVLLFGVLPISRKREVSWSTGISAESSPTRRRKAMLSSGSIRERSQRASTITPMCGRRPHRAFTIFMCRFRKEEILEHFLQFHHQYSTAWLCLSHMFHQLKAPVLSESAVFRPRH